MKLRIEGAVSDSRSTVRIVDAETGRELEGLKPLALELRLGENPTLTVELADELEVDLFMTPLSVSARRSLAGVFEQGKLPPFPGEGEGAGRAGS